MLCFEKKPSELRDENQQQKKPTHILASTSATPKFESGGGGEVLPENLGGGVRCDSGNPYPASFILFA